MTTEELALLQGLLEKATQGTWIVERVRTETGQAFRIGTGEMLTAGKGACIIYDDYRQGETERSANAELIAAAVNALPALILTGLVAQSQKDRLELRGIALDMVYTAVKKRRGAVAKEVRETYEAFFAEEQRAEAAS